MSAFDSHSINQALEMARVHWGLGEANISVVAVRENHVYQVDSLRGMFALRLHRPGYRNLDQIHSELQWMDMLAEQGLHVPKPIAAKDDSLTTIADEIVIDLLTWLDGRPMRDIEPTTEQYYQLGRLLSQMHNLADNWEPPATFNRPTWNLLGDSPSWGPFWNNPLLTQNQTARFLAFRDEARALLAASQWSTGLIHADLVPDNVLVNNGRLQPIDFDDGGFGYRLFDLATVTRRSRVRDRTDKFAEAAVAGYSEQSVYDQQGLKLFEAIRGCTYVGWNIPRLHEAGGVERNSRFIHEAELSIDRFFYG